MITPISYHRPASLTEALQLAQEPGAIALAGGAATFGSLDLPYQTIIDLQAIPDLKRIEAVESNIYFGAACSLQQIVETAELPEAVRRSLTRAIPLNHRHGTSIGESLLQVSRFPEWLAVLVAHDAGVEFLDFKGKSLVSAVSELLENDDPFAGKIITGLHISLLGHGEALGAAHIARTPADSPILCGAAFVQLEGDTVEMAYAALGGGIPQAAQRLHLLALEGQPLSDEAIRTAVESVADQLDPTSDYLAGADYRRAMIPVVLRRALEDCRDFLRSRL
jgi:aerobic carbon-monoxide dehydrogenase medium subunit